jgi:hypothetical protein
VALYSSPELDRAIAGEELAMKSILMLVSGVLCVGGGLLHGSGIRIIHGAAASANVPAQLAEIIDLAWVFMSMGMLTFAAILITCGLQMRKKNYGGRVFAGWAAVCLILFSGGSIIHFGYDSHFLFFLIVGALAAIACLPDKKAA